MAVSPVDRLMRLDTCQVSDALDKLGERGTVSGIESLTGPTKIAGRAVTVKLVAAGKTTPRRHLCSTAIESAAKGDVIVVEHHARDDCAGWGGLLSAAAKVRGLSGTIIDGLARDIDESRDAGYPIFARGATPLTARRRVVEEDFNIPVAIGGIEVTPGDFVLADGSGIVFVRAARVEVVLKTAEAIASREAAMTKAVEDGTPVSEVMGGAYETMLGDEADG